MEIYQLKITLLGIRPPIWRRILVPSSVTMSQLHIIIQESMGWENYHLFSFEYYGEQYDDQAGGLSKKLGSIGLEIKSEFKYVYDFGDNWEHGIVLEKVLSKDKTMHYPVCTAGKRACPPEDSGSVWGYQSMLAVLSNKHDPEYEEMVEWVGEDFDSESFSIAEVNARLGN